MFLLFGLEGQHFGTEGRIPKAAHDGTYVRLYVAGSSPSCGSLSLVVQGRRGNRNAIHTSAVVSSLVEGYIALLL